MTIGEQGFLPWLRRGLGTALAEGSEGPRGSVQVDLRVGTERDTQTVTQRLTLAGPEDVRGLDARVILRTWPRADILDAEPNYLPLVEFSQPDLPWRFTPSAPPSGDASGRLLPWLCLLVFKADEATVQPPTPRRPLAVMQVADPSWLPRLEQAWAWAHVQVFGEERPTAERVRDLLQHRPTHVVAHLLSLRRLSPKTAYTAALVPVFRRGALAGLGEPVDPGVGRLEFAWGPASREVRLPIYYSWRFTTGVGGDFEELARRLKPRPLPPTVGTRPLSASAPGMGVPPAAEATIGLEAALEPPDRLEEPWKYPANLSFVEGLRTLLDLPAQLLSTPRAAGAPRLVVAPPLYGRWHAARDRLPPGAPEGWFAKLNTDPRLRVASAMGTEVVQRLQQALMASAWQQLEGVLQANTVLRQAQLAREASRRIHARRLAPASDEGLLFFAGPVLSRIRSGSGAATIRAAIHASPIAEGVFDPQWRRLARPRGLVGRRQGRQGLVAFPAFLARMNEGRLAAVDPSGTPSGVVTPLRVAQALPLGASRAEARELYEARAQQASFPAMLLLTAGLLDPIGTDDDSPRGSRKVLGDAVSGGSFPLDPSLAVDVIASLPPRPDFALRPASAQRPDTVSPSLDGASGDSAAASLFRQALVDLFRHLGTPPEPAPPRTQVDLAALASTVRAALDPERTIPAAIEKRLRLAPRLAWSPRDPLEPIMAAPEFPQPMYEPLRDASQGWLLPGLDAVPTDSVTLAKINRRFLEAYMVGLNHEMARELLWHGYPTDQRGSYFRQFWDTAGFVPESTGHGTPELRDVAPLHTWAPETSELGAHPAASEPVPEQVVLVIRGEILRRYPNTTIYAQRSLRGVGPRPGDLQRRPVFSGTLRPDVTFLGFNLARSALESGEVVEGRHWDWYFVLEEQVGEALFGLDETRSSPASAPRTWDDLAWADVLPAAPGAAAYIDVTAALPWTPLEPGHLEWGPLSTTPRASSAHVGAILLQKPMRVAILASSLLHPEEEPS